MILHMHTETDLDPRHPTFPLKIFSPFSFPQKSMSAHLHRRPSSPHFRWNFYHFRRRPAISARLHRWPSSPLPAPTDLSPSPMSPLPSPRSAFWTLKLGTSACSAPTDPIPNWPERAEQHRRDPSREGGESSKGLGTSTQRLKPSASFAFLHLLPIFRFQISNKQTQNKNPQNGAQVYFHLHQVWSSLTPYFKLHFTPLSQLAVHCSNIVGFVLCRLVNWRKSWKILQLARRGLNNFIESE